MNRPSRRNSNPSDAILVAGSGRSGTTWLGEIIAANPNFRIIFEPFNCRDVPEARRAGLPLFAYARPGESYPEWAAFAERVLCGRIENPWVNRQGARRRAVSRVSGHRRVAWRRLIKEIRVNALLGWLDELFHPKIVYVTRHPCAVVLSRVKLSWETHLDIFMAQSQLMADYLEPFRECIESAQSQVQKHAAMWCIENLVPLRQMPKYDWVFTTYEQMYSQPEVEVKRILHRLGVRKTWFTERATKHITRITRADSNLRRGTSPLDEWQHSLTPADIRSILYIVEIFGITLYDDAVMPHRPSSMLPT